MIQKDTERTRTLRGVGLTPKTLTGLGSPQPTLPTAHNPCPCCRVKADLVPADVAACLGLAIALLDQYAMTKDYPGAKDAVCALHRRLIRLLVDEMRSPPGDRASWDD
jgi:hypothetical protein